MKRKLFSEAQITAILKEHEAGVATADLRRKQGMSSASFYGWQAKYGGIAVTEAQNLKGLDGENAKPKRFLADAMLDNTALKDLRGKIYDLSRLSADSQEFRVRTD